MSELLMLMLALNVLLLIRIRLLVYILVLHIVRHLFLESKQWAMDCHYIVPIVMGEINASSHRRCIDPEAY
jgi:hypothetical protein